MLKKEKKGFFSLRVKLGNCVHYIQEIARTCSLPMEKEKKKEKERKKTWPLFAEKTTGNVNKNKEDKLP